MALMDMTQPGRGAGCGLHPLATRQRLLFALSTVSAFVILLFLIVVVRPPPARAGDESRLLRCIWLACLACLDSALPNTSLCTCLVASCVHGPRAVVQTRSLGCFLTRTGVLQHFSLRVLHACTSSYSHCPNSQSLCNLGVCATCYSLCNTSKCKQVLSGPGPVWEVFGNALWRITSVAPYELMYVYVAELLPTSHRNTGERGRRVIGGWGHQSVLCALGSELEYGVCLVLELLITKGFCYVHDMQGRNQAHVPKPNQTLTPPS